MYVYTYDINFKGDNAIREGPTTDLMFVQWLKSNVSPLAACYCRSFQTGWLELFVGNSLH